MLLNLAGNLRALSEVTPEPFVARLTEDSAISPVERRRSALLTSRTADAPPGFRAYFYQDEGQPAHRDAFLLAPDLAYLVPGDVVRVDPVRRRLRTLYRRHSPSNSLLVTERCDNFCVMCSQPPKEADDSWLVDELLEAIPLFSPDTSSLGITGGEPALLGDRLFQLLAALRDHLPRTALHLLSNGRAFADAEFSRKFAALDHQDLLVAIPLYSDIAQEHDFVVQARGAYDETIRGILNLKRLGVRVEIRVVIHSQTVARLPELATFIARNLTFVDHVALMGLELMGFAKTNLDALWTDPIDYKDTLEAAVRILNRARVPLSVYNHQLCVVTPFVRHFACKSISDWKNMYAPECSDCAKRDDCGGFFASSALRKSRGIHAMITETF